MNRAGAVNEMNRRQYGAGVLASAAALAGFAAMGRVALAADSTAVTTLTGVVGVATAADGERVYTITAGGRATLSGVGFFTRPSGLGRCSEEGQQEQVGHDARWATVREESGRWGVARGLAARSRSG